MPNVFIFPTSDRTGQAALIDHYNRSGWKVFVPKYKTLGLRWDWSATWPAMLSRSSSGVRNLELYGFERDENFFFGEDSFLRNYSGREHESLPTCDIVDLETCQIEFDVYHTLRGGEAFVSLYREIARNYMKKAKWISSSVNPWDGAPGSPDNIAAFVPASYENKFRHKNYVTIVATDIELTLLDVELSEKKLPVAASFNHNFAIRQPQDYEIFKKINQLLLLKGHDPVINYGGNIRGLGADIRYSKSGPTGNFETLSPRDALKKTSSASSVLHLKQNDWGGGVFYYSMICGTPIVTTNRYVKASCSEKQIINDYNAVVSDDPEILANAIIRINTEEKYAERLSMGMKSLKNSAQNSCGWKTEEYWKSWNTMLEKTLSA